ncbi:YggS family pyridoxal phosphate-dependent enzyme [Saccharobesus litoralis]|uniref:Pyridoxal phosphate homeostasis protein n=1 Tax=Saccharobesus litoralis TaxID=2172099 RepID=A0A2S0VTF6_9ALTE|nr:YggS family pyridoxal phosphate-dependent enzyme [Saccharobesus litoralis]AWB67487.1 YggS family pyridoxal phosphate-dependent enzyme [Saccharobesus litoralis]
MNTIAERLEIARTNLTKYASNAQRKADEIQLLAVSKTKPIADIEQAYAAGQRLFGENYVQEGIEKIQALSQLTDLDWHFIGPLQSNKTKPVAEHFNWVQSLDREKIAKRLNEQRPSNKPKLNVLIQVNVAAENSKSGVLPEQVAALANYISQLPNLCLRGLMAIPVNTQDENEQNQHFAAMKSLFEQLKNQYSTIDTLSMGMSQDSKTAIANGSTMVRIGTAIFGVRESKPTQQN